MGEPQFQVPQGSRGGAAASSSAARGADEMEVSEEEDELEREEKPDARAMPGRFCFHTLAQCWCSSICSPQWLRLIGLPSGACCLRRVLCPSAPRLLNAVSWAALSKNAVSAPFLR